MAPPTRQLGRAVLAALPAVAIFVIAGGLLGAGIVDDAYIFLRYAENWAAGEGWVFNPGQRVEGYSSPLWMLVLSGIAMVGADLPAAAVTASGCSVIAILFVLSFAGASSAKGTPVLCAAILTTAVALCPPLIYWGWSGMDSALFALLFLATFLSFARALRGPHPAGFLWPGLCFALAALTRAEMLALLPTYLFFVVLANGPRSAGSVVRRAACFVSPLVLVAVQALWRWHYYGAVLPSTYYAKVDVALLERLGRGWSYAVDFVRAYDLHWAVLLLGLLWSLGLWSLPDRLGGLGASVIGTWAAIVMLVGGDHFALSRFFVPVLPLGAFLLLRELDKVIARAPERLWRRRLGLAVVWVAFLFVNASVFLSDGIRRAREEVEYAERWAVVGRWLRNNVPPETRLAAITVGAIPFYSRLETVDLLGLVTPEVARRGRVFPDAEIGHQKYNTEHVLAAEPDLVLYLDAGRRRIPRAHREEDIPVRWAYALLDFVRNEQARGRYRLGSVRLEDGSVIDFLERVDRRVLVGDGGGREADRDSPAGGEG